MSILACVLLLGLGGAAANPAPAAMAELTLQPFPSHVYKAEDRSHEPTASWIFSLTVQSTQPIQLAPESMAIDLMHGRQVLRHSTYNREGFEPLTYTSALSPTLPDGAPSPSPLYWPLSIRLRYVEPATLPVDAMHILVKLKDAQGRTHTVHQDVAISTYQQKAQLIFPFRGKGIVLQAGAMNGGHRDRSGQYALDSTVLDEGWSPLKPGDGKHNADYYGYGHDLLAPADGTVVRVRNDRPDQPVGDTSDPAYYAPEFPRGGDPGNNIVIDHGNGEFSMIAHLQPGSIRVTPGQRVAQGQVIGKLGHSGDTDTPHVHYQLQSGPDFRYADALPCHFDNIAQKILDRGTYFEAK
ncbi:M23 family metallopeptidase [Cognatiluteimonas telluris]|uniref:M23 family metallopeptidase n=1 Tax=Cognatiluteimonas telluris TaxID=1104775 RepID=UPI001407BA91|nr:M23 family metallopeptidase [Lysobacter telluris]